MKQPDTAVPLQAGPSADPGTPRRPEVARPNSRAKRERSAKDTKTAAPAPNAKPEPAADRAVRIVQEAIKDGRIRLARTNRGVAQIFIGASGPLAVGAVHRRAQDEVRWRLRDLYHGVAGMQPSDAAMRAMVDTVRAAAERVPATAPPAAPSPPTPQPGSERAGKASGGPASEVSAPPDDADDTPIPEGGVQFERAPDSNPSQADLIVRLIDDAGVDLWHTPSGDLYATTREGGRAEHRPIGSRDLRRWIQKQFFDSFQKAPRREAMADALGVLEGRALGGPEHDIHVRIAGVDGTVYLDLNDRERRIVEIGPSSWNVVADAPVRFRRPAGSLPLPMPIAGGSIDLLKPLLNVPDDDTWILLVGFLLGALHPTGPYIVLVLIGEQGTAKSTAARVLVLLLDPKDAPLRRPPREERDLAIAARHGRIVAFNNLSHLSPDLSDAISSLATEGGFTTRTLYTDDEETRFKDRRPVLMNGIPDFVTRGDLGDRSAKATLQAIPKGKRRPEEEVLAEFERVRPLVLGALCDAVSRALRDVATVKIADLPRMADAAKWITAAEPALGWKPGTFLEAYRRAIGASSAAILEDHPVARVLTRLLDQGEWSGSMTDLLVALTARVNDAERKDKRWPATPRGLSGELRRIAPDLRRVGYTVTEAGRDDRTRRGQWRLAPPERTEPGSDAPHAPHAPDSASTTGYGGASEASHAPATGADAPQTREGGPCGASPGEGRSVSFGDAPYADDVLEAHGGASGASERAERRNQLVSGLPCPRCGCSSPYDGRHTKNCPTCGPSCPCVSCQERRDASDE